MWSLSSWGWVWKELLGFAYFVFGSCGCRVCEENDFSPHSPGSDLMWVPSAGVYSTTSCSCVHWRLSCQTRGIWDGQA